MQNDKARQWSVTVDGAPREVIAATFELDLDKFDATHTHRHRKAQLIYTVNGLLHCASGGTIWAVPARCAMWIPGGIPHAVFGSRDTRCRSIWLESRPDLGLPQACCTLAVGALLRELLLRACTIPRLYDPDGAAARLLAVLIDEISAAPVEELQLPTPRDPRLVELTGALLRSPARRDGLAAWARRAGLSTRSMTRLFREETGMSLGSWRRRLHVVTAVGWLAAGRSVQMVAYDLGYAGASSFIKMFRGVVNHPPGRYVADAFGKDQEAPVATTPDELHARRR